MGSPPSPITFDPQRAEWERQPRESSRHYRFFVEFRDLDAAKRTVEAIAAEHSLNPTYLRGIAKAGQWKRRAEAYDQFLEGVYVNEMVQRARRAARHDAQLLDAMVAKLARALHALDPATLSPSELAKWVGVALTQRRRLFDDKTANLIVSGPGGGPVPIEVSDFEQLSEQEQEARIYDLMETTQTRLKAVSGGEG